MHLKRLLLTLLNFVLAIKSIACITVDNSFQEDKSLSNFLESFLNSENFLIDCPVVYGNSDPGKSSFILDRESYRPRLLFKLEVPNENPTPEVNVSVTYGYPWNYNPEAKDIGECALHVIQFKDKADLEQLVAQIPQTVKINWGMHYFLLLKEDMKTTNINLLEDILMNSTVTDVMKHKIFPVKKNDDGDFEIFSACFYCNGGFPKITHVGTKTAKPETMKLKRWYPDFTRNMNGTFFNIVFVESSSKKQARDLLYGNELYIVVIPYMYLISEALNYNYSVHTIDIGLSGAFDRRMEDGMWVGLAGDVLYSKADFSLGSIATSTLMPFIDYSFPITDTVFFIISSKPKIYFSPWIVVKAFAVTLWIAISVTVFIMTIVYGYTLKDDTVNYSPFTNRYGFAFYFIVSSVIESPVRLPFTVVPRILLTCWLLSCIVISFSYQSSLTSIMTVPSKIPVPTTYPEVIEMDYMYGGNSLSNAFFQYLMMEAEVEYLAQVRDNIINFDSEEECFEAALQKNLVCITVPELGAGPMYSFLSEDYIPQLQANYHSGLSVSGCSIFRKGFVGLESYNRAIRRIRESGIFSFWDRELHRRFLVIGLRKKRNSTENPDHVAEASARKWKPLSLPQLKAPFLILIAVMILATATFVLEMITKFM